MAQRPDGSYELGDFDGFNPKYHALQQQKREAEAREQAARLATQKWLAHTAPMPMGSAKTTPSSTSGAALALGPRLAPTHWARGLPSPSL